VGINWRRTLAPNCQVTWGTTSCSPSKLLLVLNSSLLSSRNIFGRLKQLTKTSYIWNGGSSDNLKLEQLACHIIDTNYVYGVSHGTILLDVRCCLLNRVTCSIPYAGFLAM
jgi:hypothetical protein